MRLTRLVLLDMLSAFPLPSLACAALPRSPSERPGYRAEPDGQGRNT